jgi:hypothetical protein
MVNYLLQVKQNHNKVLSLHWQNHHKINILLPKIIPYASINPQGHSDTQSQARH